MAEARRRRRSVALQTLAAMDAARRELKERGTNFLLGEWGGERAKVNPRSRETTRERGESRETPRYELYPRVWPTTQAIKSPFLFILFILSFFIPIAIVIAGEIINGVGPPRQQSSSTGSSQV